MSEIKKILESVRINSVNEQEDETTGCPYTNILNTLLNNENATVEDYDKAIIHFNESSDMPEDTRNSIIERLRHIKDEELEHVRELKEIKDILDGKADKANEEPVEVSTDDVAVVVGDPVIDDDTVVVEEGKNDMKVAVLCRYYKAEGDKAIEIDEEEFEELKKAGASVFTVDVGETAEQALGIEED